MMYRIISAIAGYYRFFVNGRAAERVLNRLMTINADIFDIERINENEITFSAGVIHYKKIKHVLDEMRSVGIKYRTVLRGFPEVLYRYRKRTGLVIGIFLSCALIWASSLFIWTVEIRGLVSVTDETMREMLSDAGLYEGKRISDINFDDIRFELINRYPEISYAIFFISGTHALVSISERAFPPDTSKNNDPYNLVAKCDGVIVDSAVSDGMTMVKSGEFVRKGDLLVSGIVELQTTAYKTVHAKGSVFAKTVHEFSVTVPFESHEKVYTGNEAVKRRLEILDFSVPLYLSSDCGFGKYEAYKRTENVILFDLIRLPFRLTETSFAEYKTPLIYLTPEKAENKAYDMYKEYIKNELSEREIVKEEISVNEEEKGITFKAVIWCIEDIAEEKAFLSEEYDEP